MNMASAHLLAERRRLCLSIGIPGAAQRAFAELIHMGASAAQRLFTELIGVPSAEGMLVKKKNGRVKNRHFFLFNDSLVWGSVITQNVNIIKQVAAIRLTV
jgi:hypothetical protein